MGSFTNRHCGGLRHRAATLLQGWFAALLLMLAAPLWAQSTQTIREVQVAPGLCREGQAAQSVQLPDDWALHGMSTPGVACYRAQVILKRTPDEPLGLRIDRLPGNHRVVVNGMTVQTHDMQGDAITSMASLPHLIEIPAEILRGGDNEVWIDVRMNPFQKVGISPLVIGPLDQVRPAFLEWQTLTVDLPRILNLSVAGMAIFILLAWRARPGDKVFVYFGCLMLVMCVRNAFYFLDTVAWPHSLVTWMLFATHALATYFLTAFGLTYANASVRRLIWPVRLLGIGVPILGLALLDTPHFQVLTTVAYPVMLICSCLVVLKVVEAALQRHLLEAIAMTAGPIAAAISVGHDYLFMTPMLDVTAQGWTPYCTPLLFSGYALTLMRKFIATMSLAERMNAHLEERVVERTRALESANQAKTRFLAAASHDLRQPTAAIGLLVSLLRKQEAPAEVHRIAGMLHEAVASMESLLVGLLDISRLDAGSVQANLQPVYLHDVFQAVRVHEQSAADAKGLSLRFRLPRFDGDDLMVHTDPILIHGIIRNLVANAIRYTERGGVLVAVRRCRKQRVRIEVWDTGIGIAPDQLDRIFDEFYQVGNAARERNKGIGLGLAIVRRTADVLGEQIRVRSKPGKGSCFSIELPVHRIKPTRSQAPASVLRPMEGRSVWLVEDDVMLRNALDAMLQSWGAHTRVWPDGEALLDDLPKLLSPNQPEQHPDILVTDFRLPGINGLTLAQTVQTYLIGTKFCLLPLIISGETDPNQLARMSTSGFATLPKPFRSEQLLEQLLVLHEAKAV
ncbi:ATP-binding protein [Aquabacterium sp.]|uniref:ATP-binding protein n=1 Tax=Aquabacterium sp. TaxID=1872578 RepID=UPI0035B4FA2A